MGSKLVRVKLSDFMNASRTNPKFPAPSATLSRQAFDSDPPGAPWRLYVEVEKKNWLGGGKAAFVTTDLKVMDCELEIYPHVVEWLQDWNVPFDVI